MRIDLIESDTIFPGISYKERDAVTSVALGKTSYTRVVMREEIVFSTVTAPVARTATNAIGITRLFFINSTPLNYRCGSVWEETAN
jgi:hypothetical protein